MHDRTQPARHDTPAPDFEARVLALLPAPVLVLDREARIVFVNPAMCSLTGWSEDDAVGSSIVDHLHPDDVDWVVEAYARITAPDAPPSRSAGRRPGLRLRILSRDGTPIAVEANGGAGLADDIVGGTVYHVRHAIEDSLLDDIFAGIGGGASLEDIVTDVIELVACPPLAIEAAVFQQFADGRTELIAASDAHLASLPVGSTSAVPWSTLASQPTHTPVGNLPDDVRLHLASAGFRECFHAGAHAPNVASTLRLVAATRDEHRVLTGVLQRIERARELMSVVLLKRHNDLILEDAASRDALTGLPNRAGLRRRFDGVLGALDGAALMFVDLDGFKEVNDVHGHSVGDRVITTAADRLRRAVRVDDVVARIGGDEFAIMIVEPDTRLDGTVVRRLADRVVGMLSEPVVIGEVSVHISASVGVARLDGGQTLGDALMDADAAMYDAKRAGGNRYRNAPTAT